MSSSSDTPADDERTVVLHEEHALSRLAEYEAALDRLLGLALGRGHNASARSEAMRRFLLAGKANRVEIVVHDAERVRTDCPRLVTLQRHFPHAIRIHRTLPHARGVYDPFCVVDGSHYARRFHFDSQRGLLVLNDAEGAGLLVQRFADILEASQPAVTGTTLGL